MTYYNAAMLAHSFTQSHLCWNGEAGCFSDLTGFDVASCQSVQGETPGDVAMYLEGMSVLAHKTGDRTLYEL